MVNPTPPITEARAHGRYIRGFRFQGAAGCSIKIRGRSYREALDPA